MKKMLTAVLGGTAVATMAFASASLLTVDGGTIQAGSNVASLACDVDGVKANWGLETKNPPNSVMSVRISDIAEECGGAEMFIKTNLMDEAKMVKLDGSDSATLRFDAPYPAPEDITAIRIWIEG